MPHRLSTTPLLSLSLSLSLSLAPVIALGCGASPAPSAQTVVLTPDPAPTGANGPNATPAPPATVTASVLSATLGEACAGGPTLAARCAAGADCSLPCPSSSLQLVFESRASGAGAAPSHVEIVTVRLLDAQSGRALGELRTGSPQRWLMGQYSPWDRAIEPGGRVQSMWSMSAPAWDSIQGDTFGPRFRLEVVVRIDGREQTVQSAPLGREPQIVT